MNPFTRKIMIVFVVDFVLFLIWLVVLDQVQKLDTLFNVLAAGALAVVVQAAVGGIMIIANRKGGWGHAMLIVSLVILLIGYSFCTFSR